MKKNLKNNNNDQPKTESNDTAEQNALADIHAAMMEELGIGRKDTLPLQDTYQIIPKHSKIQFKLNPENVAPGVNTWRNAVFDDVDPAEGEIDSIADGQLARIRRRLMNNQYPESLLGKNKNSSLDKGFVSHPKNSKDLVINRGQEGSRDQDPLPKTPNDIGSSPLPPSKISKANRNKIDKSRLNTSIARLRSAVPPTGPSTPTLPGASKASTASSKQKKSNASSIGSSSDHQKISKDKVKGPSSKSKSKGRSQRSKPQITRPLLQRSAWGALDEDAFLAYAIKPTPPTSPQAQNKNGIQSPIYISSSSSSTSSPSSQPEFIGQKSSFLTQDKFQEQKSEKSAQNKQEFKDNSLATRNQTNHNVSQETSQEKLTPLIRDMNIKSPEYLHTILPQTSGQNNLEGFPILSPSNHTNLMETKSQNTAEIFTGFSLSQNVNMEGRAMIQVDAGLGLPGYARLRGDSRNLFLELQQSDRIIACESLESEIVLITDSMNPKFNLIIEILKDYSPPNPIWRISFEFSHIKNEFLKVILNYKAQKRENNLLQNSVIDQRKSIIDILDHKTMPFFKNLIHIGVPKRQENIRPNDAKIRTETLNDLSEIGGISHV